MINSNGKEYRSEVQCVCTTVWKNLGVCNREVCSKKKNTKTLCCTQILASLDAHAGSTAASGQCLGTEQM